MIEHALLHKPEEHLGYPKILITGEPQDVGTEN